MTTLSTLRFAGVFILLATVLLSGCGKQSGTSDKDMTESQDYVSAMNFYNQNAVDSAIVYFEKLTVAYPGATAAWTWYAESNRRLGKMDEADDAARKALEIDEHYAFAHAVLGDLYNPQYSVWEHADADVCWEQLNSAVECDQDEGNAWLSIWIEAMRRENIELENKALVRLYETDFFAGPALEQNRWMLQNLPKNALYITNGDLDTYPALMLQKNESLRPDVSVVNISLLNLPWYIEEISERNHLAPPMSWEKMESFQPYRDENGNLVLLAYKVLQYWLDQESKLSRPIVAAVTCSPEVLAIFRPGKVLMGSCYMKASSTDETIDPDAVRVAIDGLDGKLFVGAAYSEQDKSAVRRASEQGFSAMIPFQAGIEYVQHLFDNNENTEAGKYIDHLRNFATDAGMDEEDLETLNGLEEKIK